MKVKNVLKGLIKQYDLQEINIITPQCVEFSGTLDGWKATTTDMILHKRKIEESEVTNRMIFNNRKAFIFINEID